MSVTDESLILRDELVFYDITKFAEVTEYRFNTNSDLKDINNLIKLDL